MLFCCRMYSSVVWKPASSLAAATKLYSRFSSVFCCGIRSVSRRATWSWNPPRSLPMRGVTVQVSEPNINTACTMALKKNPDTRSSAPSLLMILVILSHTALARDKFLTTNGQPLSADDITRPRYYKEVTISRGLPYALNSLYVPS